MDTKLFHRIVDSYAEYRPELRINRLRGSLDYPFLTIAGLGEPMLHPEALSCVEYACRQDFKVIMFTNVSRIDREKAHRLVASGISDIYVSFWGIEKNEYEAAMKIPFETSLANLEYLAPLAKENGVRLFATWVQVPELHSTPEQIQAFFAERGIRTDMEDESPENASSSNSVWNRGGSVEDIPQAALHAEVDFRKEFWCSQLYFADTYTWDGDAIICSQDYFQKHEVIGNIRDEGPRELGRRKAEVFRGPTRRPICTRCRKQREYSIATHPWDAVLPIDELKRYRYDVR